MKSSVSSDTEGGNLYADQDSSWLDLCCRDLVLSGAVYFPGARKVMNVDIDVCEYWKCAHQWCGSTIINVKSSKS